MRVIAATNQDIEARSRDGLLRQDLLYRVQVVTLVLPPLRERPEDVPLLVAHFLEQAPGPRRPDMSRAALDILTGHDWPGNVRELRNAIDHAALLCRGTAILPEHLPRLLSAGGTGPAEEFHRAAAALLDLKIQEAGGQEAPLYEQIVQELERAVIAEALKLTGHNQARTAAMLQIHRTTLRNKVRQYGLGK